MSASTLKIFAIASFGIAILATLTVFIISKNEPVLEPVIEPEITVPETKPFVSSSTIGVSVEGRNIEMYSFGDGEESILFVGGIHGGYEWNSIVLAYDMIDQFSSDESLVPEGITVRIIPNLNPDGLAIVTNKTGRIFESDIPDPSNRVAAGRFNANNVDLNRNFACKWAPESTWRGEVVSAGTQAFSEPEAQALKNVVENISPKAVIFWHSQANNVYASECENGVLPETLDIMSIYAQAGGYGEVPVFDAYPITGDAEGWLASLGIPAITVELGSYQSTEWNQNLAGVKSILNKYGK
ncbi:hypothetical protein KC723_03125 [Candidatus Kaiserbacteria bacterium]|nr:hypothetical protein [Candidatus Kaiserbacteria bacterium]